MNKKTLIITLLFCTLVHPSFAITLQEGKEAFAQYVEYSNKCSKQFRDMFDNNTVIKRIVQKPDGTASEKILSVDMYKTMLKYYSKIALWRGYRNDYTDVKYRKVGDTVEVECIRHPSTSTDALKAKIIFAKNDFDRTIVKEECFHTNASFLLK